MLLAQNDAVMAAAVASSSPCDAGDGLSLKGVVVPHSNSSSSDVGLQQTKPPMKVHMTSSVSSYFSANYHRYFADSAIDSDSF